MVKSLQDICLGCIARSVSSFNRLGTYLSHRHKEVLLERMCWHGLLSPEDTPNILYHLFSHSVQRVNLSFSSQINDRTLDLLGRSGCLLSSLTIHDCPNVTDKGIAHLRRILTKANEINLTKLKQVTGEGFKSVVSRSVRSVSLKRSAAVTDAGVISLIQNCYNIQKLNLCELYKLTDAAFVSIAEVLNTNLIELEVSDMNLVTAKSTLALAQHCRNLSVMSFESCVRLDGSGFEQLAENCDLSSVDLGFCYKISSQSLEVVVSILRAKGCLISLDVMGIDCSVLGLELIASTTCLTSLALCGVKSLTDEHVEMITSRLGVHLMDFDISNCLMLTDDACACISKHCRVLERLGMSNLREIKGTQLSKYFQDGDRAKMFKGITLSGSKQICSSVVRVIVASCPSLELLTVSGLKDITDDIAVSVARNCPHAQHLSFRNCELTDDGVCELAVHCPRLTLIELSGIHSLTDKSVIALAENCPLITDLHISGCANITKQCVTYLKDSSVHYVFVSHSIPNAPFGLLMAKDLDTGVFTRVDHIEFDGLR